MQKFRPRLGMNLQAHHFKSVRASFKTSSAERVLAVPFSISPRRRSASLSQSASEFVSPGALRHFLLKYVKRERHWTNGQ
jgi:hypothetical protein